MNWITDNVSECNVFLDVTLALLLHFVDAGLSSVKCNHICHLFSFAPTNNSDIEYFTPEWQHEWCFIMGRGNKMRVYNQTVCICISSC